MGPDPVNRIFAARNPDVAERALGDEMLVVLPAESRLFCLNPQAALLWNHADGRTPLESIVENVICREYDVERAVAYADARAAVEELAAAGLLRLSDTPLEC
jgi:hypothetical protein